MNTVSPNDPNERSGTEKGSFVRRVRSPLLAGVCAFALGGLVFGDLVTVDMAANAQGEAAGSEATVAEPVTPQAAPFSFADMVETVQPAVVSIRVSSQAEQQSSSFEGFGFPELPEGHPLERFFRDFGGRGGPGPDEGNRPPQQRMGQGSGFFISADGYIVTNNHVVDGASEVTVVLDDGSTFEAEVVGTDPRTDLALVKVNAEREFTFVEFSDDEVRVGDWVVAVGNPFGLGGSVTAGIVSASGRYIGAGPYDDFIQIDASINRGNSGGPAFDMDGRVAGVNTAIFSPSGGSVGIGFAIPAAVAAQVIEALRDDGAVTRGWLGVQIQPITEEIAASLDMESEEGALVSVAQDDSPATEAGISSGDAILAVNGESVADPRALSRTIAGLQPGTDVDLTIWRNGSEETVTVTLGTLPDEEQASLAPESEEPTGPATLEDFGLSIAPAASAGAGEAGVLVTNVDPAGQAAEQGLSEGDIILDVGGQAVSSPSEVEELMETARADGRRAVLMRVQSGDQVRFLALSFDRA